MGEDRFVAAIDQMLTSARDLQVAIDRATDLAQRARDARLVGASLDPPPGAREGPAVLEDHAQC